MITPAGSRLVSRQVTAEDAARFTGENVPRIREIAGDCLIVKDDAYFIQVSGSDLHPLPAGYWVIRYGPGDCGILTAGACRRYFGEIAP